MEDITLWVGGYPATEIAAHTPPTWETWADGGCGPASWAFSLTMRSQHQALRPGALVEIRCGGLPVWAGLMTEPDRTTWECTAYGLASAGSKFPALDSGGASTRGISTATTEAITLGWLVKNSSGISGAVSGDATGNPISIAQLWTEYAQQLGQRWGVDGRRRLYMRADPTAPSWTASPDSAAFGVTDEDAATRIIGRYLDSTSGLYAKADAGSGYPVETVDLSERGAMSLAQANAVLAGALTRKAGPAWVNGVTLTREQLQTAGGMSAFLPAVRAGQAMRSFGLADAVYGMAPYTTIGKTRYTAGADVIYVEPVNTAPRDLRSVIAAA